MRWKKKNVALYKTIISIVSEFHYMSNDLTSNILIKKNVGVVTNIGSERIEESAKSIHWLMNLIEFWLYVIFKLTTSATFAPLLK